MVFIKVQEKQNLHPKIRRIILTSSLGADQEHFGYHSGYRNFAGIRKYHCFILQLLKNKNSDQPFLLILQHHYAFYYYQYGYFFLPFRNAQVKKVTAWLCKKKA